MADEQYICTGAGDPRCFPVCPHAIPHIHQDSCDRTCSKNPNPACVLHDTEDDVEHGKYICNSAGRPKCTENCEHAIPHYPFDGCDMECSVYWGANCVPCDEQGIKDTDVWAPTEAPEKLICPGAGSDVFCDTCEHAVPHEHCWDCELECNLVDVDGSSECVPAKMICTESDDCGFAECPHRVPHTHDDKCDQRCSYSGGNSSCVPFAPGKESDTVPSDDDTVLRPERGFSEEEITTLVGTPTTSNDRKPPVTATNVETISATLGGKRILTTDDIEGIVRETTLAARVDMLRYLKRTFAGWRDAVLADTDEATENSDEFFGNDHLR